MSRIENQSFLAAPREARAALFFLEGHYQLNWREGQVEQTKFLTPAQIGRAFTTLDAFDSGWLDSFVLRCARETKRHKILSVLPGRRRKIFITDPRPAEERETASESTTDPVLELEVPLPALLLLGSGQNYYLWATLDKKINEKSRICHAPFPNLDQRGSICFGRNVAPECRLDRIDSVWRLILDSPFNSDRAVTRCRTYPDDARKLLLSLNGKNRFPKNTLLQTRHTISELWQSVA